MTTEIEELLTRAGHAAAEQLDDDSQELHDDYAGVAPTLAAFAARQWLFCWELDCLNDPAWPARMVAHLLEAAGVSALVDTLDEEMLTISVNGAARQRFDLRFDPTGDEPQVDFAYAVLGLAAHLLDCHGWLVVEDGDADLLLTAVVPRACWNAMSPVARGDCCVIEGRAELAETSPAKLWN